MTRTNRRELATVVAREQEVGVEQVDVAMVYNYREENMAMTGGRPETCECC